MPTILPIIPGLIARRKSGDVPPRKLFTRLSVDDKLVILWGMYREYSMRHISRSLPCAIDTVRRYRNDVYEDPLLAFEIPVYIQAGTKKFRCAFCASTKPNKSTIIRHVLSHIVPSEIANSIDLRHTNGRVVL
jgi:hypothetical protein